MSEVETYIAAMVMELHQRNQGTLKTLDFQMRLQEDGLLVDSMDLAEMVARIHRDFGVLIFEQSRLPTTWADVLQILVDHGQPTGDAGRR